MPLIVVNSPDSDVWQDNPGLELISEFKEFKKKEGAERSSNILKAIYYIWDPKSELRDSGLDDSKLIGDISENLLGNREFEWDEYEYIIEFYKKYNLSKLETLLLKYEREINDLDALLGKWRWSKKDLKERALAVSQYKMLFKDYYEVVESIRAEMIESEENYAGYQESLSEELGG